MTRNIMALTRTAIIGMCSVGVANAEQLAAPYAACVCPSDAGRVGELSR